MKKNLLFFLLLTLSVLNAQTTHKADLPKENISERALDYPGGINQFTQDFLFMIRAYIDMGKYAANGKFKFDFVVDEKGKIVQVEVSPKVKNSEMFIEDMIFAAKRVKKKFIPAIRNGVHAKSSFTVFINFTSDHFDHGD